MCLKNGVSRENINTSLLHYHDGSVVLSSGRRSILEQNWKGRSSDAIDCHVHGAAERRDGGTRLEKWIKDEKNGGATYTDLDNVRARKWGFVRSTYEGYLKTSVCQLMEGSGGRGMMLYLCESAREVNVRGFGNRGAINHLLGLSHLFLI